MTIFSINEEDYTEEQLAIFRKRQESKAKAKAFFTAQYDEYTADVIVTNVMIGYMNLGKGSADTFEQAWNDLGFEVVMDIVYRAVNHLPARGKGERQKNDLSRNQFTNLGAIGAYGGINFIIAFISSY